MKAEYFPPKEDVILQNEAPTDFYILVTGAVVIYKSKAALFLLCSSNVKLHKIVLISLGKLLFYYCLHLMFDLLHRIWWSSKMEQSRQVSYET